MKYIALVMISLILGASSASADVKKGQKLYLKKCKKCHGNGTKGAAMKTQDEWEEAFEDNAAIFIEWHEGTKVENYVKGDKFKNKIAPHIKDFVYEYGSDSGNVPSC